MTIINNVDVVEVLKISYLTGEGTDRDPAREVIEYWLMSGKRLIKLDPIEKE